MELNITLSQLIKTIKENSQINPLITCKSGTASFKYKNWKDKISIRHIESPVSFSIETTEWHGETLTMTAFDLDKNDIRHYAVKDIIEVYDTEESEE